MAYCRNLGENGEIYDVSRFTCQQVDYEIDYILLITYNDRMKLCRKWFITKGNSKNKTFVVQATVLVPDPFQGFHNMHFNCLYR